MRCSSTRRARSGPLWGLVCGALAACPVGCKSEAPARAQLVVFIDTNLPTTSQTVDDPALSRDLAIDSLRVDFLGPDGAVTEFRDFAAPDALDWPISFGVLPSDTKGAAFLTMRVRVFRESRAVTGALAGQSTLEPPVETTIDRVVELPAPQAGITSVHILLDGECVGIPSRFVGAVETCVSADEMAAPPTQGVSVSTDNAAGMSRVGTWPRVREVPCTLPPPNADAVCIPGGLSTLGDPALDGLDDHDAFGADDPSPRRLVELSPFYMDVTEFTVQRYRALLNAGKISVIPKPDGAEPEPSACTWAGPSSAKNDAYPLNCLSIAGAIAACAADGGTLPSEAQWEHAGRGRGQGRRYPWGNADPTCCSASVNSQVVCPGVVGVEKPQSHPPEACDGIGDVSRDGVWDLGGSLSEVMADKFQPYTGSCWSYVGIRRDPICDGAKFNTQRGGSWQDAFSLLAQPLRKSGGGAFTAYGFRCVYPGTP